MSNIPPFNAEYREVCWQKVGKNTIVDLVSHPPGQLGFKRGNLIGQGIEPVRPVLSRTYHKIGILSDFFVNKLYFEI